MALLCSSQAMWHTILKLGIRLRCPSCPKTHVQAVVNEDTDGDKAALKREIKRLLEELAAVKRQLATGPQQHPGMAAGAAGGFAAPGPVASEPQSGTPARLHAQADALLSATSPSMGQEVSCVHGLKGRPELGTRKPTSTCNALFPRLRHVLYGACQSVTLILPHWHHRRAWGGGRR